MHKDKHIHKIALATLGDSRNDFYSVRKPLVVEEGKKLDWLKDACEIVESRVLRSEKDITDFAKKVNASQVYILVIHLPVWADPIFTAKLASLVSLPIMLLGNTRPETSSIVGMLGAGGALDQIGVPHQRIYDYQSENGKNEIMAFIRAATARENLKGLRLGLFGGRSLGILTATADPSQWLRIFGVDFEYVDQVEIIQIAEALDQEQVDDHVKWLTGKAAEVRFGGIFNQDGLQKQVRSYLATKQLTDDHGFDFVGVKCQRELSDGYVSQCAAHMLFNGLLDANGEKAPVVHACESDADGALTMQILQLVSSGKPTALMDIRWYNQEEETWLLANCGAVAAAFYATKEDPTGFSQMRIEPHVFGTGGGGAYPGLISPQQVTLARLCRKNGQYWMAISKGEVMEMSQKDSSLTTSAFPQAKIKMNAGMDFLHQFGSNHMHIVSGDYSQELINFCSLVGIDSKVWA